MEDESLWLKDNESLLDKPIAVEAVLRIDAESGFDMIVEADRVWLSECNLEVMLLVEDDAVENRDLDLL